MENLLLGLFLGSFFSGLIFLVPVMNGVKVIKKTLKVREKQTTWKDVLANRKELEGSLIVYSRSKGYQEKGTVLSIHASRTNPRDGFIYTDIPGLKEIFLHHIGVPEEWMVQKMNGGFVCVTTNNSGVMVRFIFKQR